MSFRQGVLILTNLLSGGVPQNSVCHLLCPHFSESHCFLSPLSLLLIGTHLNPAPETSLPQTAKGTTCSLPDYCLGIISCIRGMQSDNKSVPSPQGAYGLDHTVSMKSGDSAAELER